MLFYALRKERLGLVGDIQYADTLSKGNKLDPLFGRDELGSMRFIVAALGDYRLHDDGRSTLSTSWVMRAYGRSTPC
jgi:hypothetical protein